MKTLIAAAISLSMLAGAVTPALADNRDHDRYEWRHDNDRHDDRRDDRHDWRDARENSHREHDWDNDRRHDRFDDRDSRSGYTEGRRDQHRYDAPRYIAPRGYYQRSWHRGDRLPREYYAGRYIVNDYNRYQLYAPPRGHHWVRVNDDVLLTAIATGAVVAVVGGLFH